MMKTKTLFGGKPPKSFRFWLVVGLLAMVIAAPNGTIIRSVLGDLSAGTLNMLRFGMIVAVTLPYVVWSYKKFKWKNVYPSILAGIFLSIANFSYITAIHYSTASYAAIIGIATPIVFVVYAAVLGLEKIKPKTVIGILIAAAGGFVIVGSGVAGASGSPSVFATVMAALNCLSLPLAMISSRKANERGVPLMASFGLSSMVVLAISIVYAFGFENPIAQVQAAASLPLLIGIAYSALLVSYTARVLSIAAYERIGAGASGALQYFETLLAVAIPIVILGEPLTTRTLAGGALILAGLYVVESRHVWRNRKHVYAMHHKV